MNMNMEKIGAEDAIMSAGHGSADRMDIDQVSNIGSDVSPSPTAMSANQSQSQESGAESAGNGNTIQSGESSADFFLTMGIDFIADDFLKQGGETENVGPTRLSNTNKLDLELEHITQSLASATSSITASTNGLQGLPSSTGSHRGYPEKASKLKKILTPKAAKTSKHSAISVNKSGSSTQVFASTNINNTMSPLAKGTTPSSSTNVSSSTSMSTEEEKMMKRSVSTKEPVDVKQLIEDLVKTLIEEWNALMKKEDANMYLMGMGVTILLLLTLFDLATLFKLTVFALWSTGLVFYQRHAEDRKKVQQQATSTSTVEERKVILDEPSTPKPIVQSSQTFSSEPSSSVSEKIEEVTYEQVEKIQVEKEVAVIAPVAVSESAEKQIDEVTPPATPNNESSKRTSLNDDSLDTINEQDMADETEKPESAKTEVRKVLDLEPTSFATYNLDEEPLANVLAIAESSVSTPRSGASGSASNPSPADLNEMKNNELSPLRLPPGLEKDEKIEDPSSQYSDYIKSDFSDHITSSVHQDLTPPANTHAASTMTPQAQAFTPVAMTHKNVTVTPQTLKSPYNANGYPNVNGQQQQQQMNMNMHAQQQFAGYGHGQFNHQQQQQYAAAYGFGNQMGYPGNQMQMQQPRQDLHVTLNNRLAATQSAMEVFAIIDECFEAFDNVNLITALYRCAKLSTPSSLATGFSNKTTNRGVIDHPNFRRLLAMYEENIPNVTSRGLANAIWALAKLNVPMNQQPFANVLQESFRRSLVVVDESNIKPQELSNTLWACATLLATAENQTFGSSPGSAGLMTSNGKVDGNFKILIKNLFVKISSPKTAGMLEQFRPQELSNMAWAFAKVLPNWSLFPMPDIFGNEIGMVTAQEFLDDSTPSSNDLSNSSDLFQLITSELSSMDQAQQLKLTQEESDAVSTFLMALAKQCSQVSDKCITTNLANVAWAFTRLDLPEEDQRSLLLALGHGAMRMRPSEWKPQEVANLLLAFGKLLSENIHPQRMEPFLSYIIDVCSNSVYQSHKGGKGMYQNGGAKPLMGYFRAPDFVAVAWTIAKFVQVNDNVTESHKRFSRNFMTNIIPNFYAAMAEASHYHLSQGMFKPQELAQFVWSYGVIVQACATSGVSQTHDLSYCTNMMNMMLNVHFSVFETSHMAILGNLRRTSPSTLNEILRNFLLTLDFFNTVHETGVFNNRPVYHCVRLAKDKYNATMDQFLRQLYGDLTQRFDSPHLAEDKTANALLAKGYINKLETFREPAQKDLLDVILRCSNLQLLTPHPIEVHILPHFRKQENQKSQ